MKKEKLNVAELATEELKSRIVSEEASVVRMKLNHAVAPMENPMQIRQTRRGIARLKTELTKRNNQQ
jgi:large subunit ribosomal protein L29